ncbi:MAG TPA: (deoxy)nucleoside triphosphate pyrophosphohydrolase [Abditibacteriaceae bacterium]|jgi:8-oxo-dGTP diphosphatase
MPNPDKPHYHIAILLLWRDGKILASKRLAEAEHLADVWEFPGGKCAPDELPIEAARREAYEELGVAIEITGQRPPLEFDYVTRHVCLHPFDAVITKGEPQPLASTELRWLAPEEFKDKEFPPANAPLLRQLRNL